jgi:hypothetical protein
MKSEFPCSVFHAIVDEGPIFLDVVKWDVYLATVDVKQFCYIDIYRCEG